MELLDLLHLVGLSLLCVLRLLDQAAEFWHLRLGLRRTVEPVEQITQLLYVKPALLLFLLFSLHLFQLLLLAREHAVPLQLLIEFLEQLLLQLVGLLKVRRVGLVYGWGDLLQEVADGGALLHARGIRAACVVVRV